MELVELDVVGAEEAKRSMEVVPEVFYISGTSFCGDDDRVAAVVEGGTQLGFRVGVEASCVEIVEAVVESVAEERNRVRLRDALDGESAETIFRDHKIGLAEGNFLHKIIVYRKTEEEEKYCVREDEKLKKYEGLVLEVRCLKYN